jgi:hypothetical protein
MTPENASSHCRRPSKALRAAPALVYLTLMVWPLTPALGGVRHERALAGGWLWQASPQGGYSATLEQCTSSTLPAQRSVTFSAQMTAVAGTQRMAMRIELQERAPSPAGDASQAPFRPVSAPGLGVWRSSEAGVKIYRYVKQITGLSAPATYRAVVRFRWLGARGRVLRRAALRTATCAQAAPAPLESAQR